MGKDSAAYMSLANQYAVSVKFLLPETKKIRLNKCNKRHASTISSAKKQTYSMFFTKKIISPNIDAGRAEKARNFTPARMSW